MTPAWYKFRLTSFKTSTTMRDVHRQLPKDECKAKTLRTISNYGI
jgi:hypothetical protein